MGAYLSLGKRAPLIAQEDEQAGAGEEVVEETPATQEETPAAQEEVRAQEEVPAEEETPEEVPAEEETTLHLPAAPQVQFMSLEGTVALAKFLNNKWRCTLSAKMIRHATAEEGGIGGLRCKWTYNLSTPAARRQVWITTLLALRQDLDASEFDNLRVWFYVADKPRTGGSAKLHVTTAARMVRHIVAN